MNCIGPVSAVLALTVLAPTGTSQMVWRQSNPPFSPAARVDHAMVGDSRRQVAVMFGGAVVSMTGSRLLSDTWEYRSGLWVQRSPATSPPARSSHAMAYDAARGVLVLFGGASATAQLNDTWEYDGVNWRQRLTANSPPAVAGHAMTYDSTRRVIVSVGGYSAARSATIDEVWEYDGMDWRRRLVANPPPDRADHSLVYDSARSVLVISGGVSVRGRLGQRESTKDVWEWDGDKVGWRYLPNPLGPFESWSRMVYDEARQKAVWIGMRFVSPNAPTHVFEVWEWDGRGWLQRSGTINPLRSWFAAAYDASRERVVLFSGNGNQQLYQDTWEYYPTNRSSVLAVGSGCVGSSGTPSLTANGRPTIGRQDFTFRIRSARPDSPAFVALALRPATLVFGACTLHLDTRAPWVRFAGQSNSSGSADFVLGIPFQSTLSGVQIESQGFVSDPNGAFFGQLAFTAGLRLRIGD